MRNIHKYLTLLIACMLTTSLSATYYIAGNGNGSRGDWCEGKNWDPSGTELVNDEVIFHNLPAEWYEFKITDGTWDNQWGYSDIDKSTSSPGYKTYGDGNNICFKLIEPADVTIRMSENKVQLIIGRNYTIVGNGNEFANDVWLGGQNWGNKNNHTIINSGNNYSCTFYNLPAGNNYQFKIKDYVESWEAGDDIYNVWGYSRLDTEHSDTGGDWGGDNIGFNLSGISDVTIALVENMVRITVTPAYFVTGNGSGAWLSGKSWKPGATECRLNPTTYDIAYDNLPAGDYIFRITNGTWGTTWNYSAMDAVTSSKGYLDAGGNDHNIKFTLDATADITISFNPSTEKITLVSSTGYFVRLPYSVVGDPVLGINWDPANTSTEMTRQDNGTYRYTLYDIDLNTHNGRQFKIVGGHAWGTYQAPASGDFTVDILEDGNYNLVFDFDPATDLATCTPVLRHDVTISQYGYSSFYSDRAYIVPDGLTATIYTAVNGEALTGETIAVIPANTGVILHGAANATYTLLQTTTTDSYDSNLLKGSTADQVINNSEVHYILGVNSGKCGLYWPNGTAEGKGSFTNAAGKAYLELAPAVAPAGARGFVLRATDTATAVEDVPADTDDTYYDLLGRKILMPQPGNVYICNGKKIVVF